MTIRIFVPAVASAAAAIITALCPPAARAEEKQAVMLVLVIWVETAQPKMSDVVAVRLLKHRSRSYERCQTGADKLNAKQKVRYSIQSDPYKSQFICYKSSLKSTYDITTDICGKKRPLYQGTCGFLIYKKSDLERLKSGELIKFQ